jgi:hypothetical protein
MPWRRPNRHRVGLAIGVEVRGPALDETRPPVFADDGIATSGLDRDRDAASTARLAALPALC